MQKDEHTVKRFDQELGELSGLVMKMGEVVQEQIAGAMEALRDENTEAAREVVSRDHLVNFMDVQADEQIVNLLALRQPMGKDLRMIISLGKSVTDIERIGDEAEAIARMALHMFGSSGRSLPNPNLLRDTYRMADLASRMLTGALDSLTRMDVERALKVARDDLELDCEFQSALRRLATYIMEDSRNVGHAIDVTFVLRSLERIGDHSKNIAEYVVYLVKGKDVRHISTSSLTPDALGSI